MRLLVVWGSPPESSFSRLPERITTPQPPGPGLPLQAPSVKISTGVTLKRSGRFQSARQLEHHSLLDAFDGLLAHVEMFGEEIDDLAHQHFRS